MPQSEINNELNTQIQYRLMEKLSESERRYRELVENLQEIVFKCDRLGHLTFLNRAWVTTLGYPVSDAIGKPLSAFIDHSDRLLWQGMLDNLSKPVRVCYELRFCDQNSVIVWLELSVQADGEAEISGSLTNITDRKRAEGFLKQANEELEIRVEQRTAALSHANQELTAALQELQHTQVQLVQAEKMSSLGQLVAGIAHEINNPVNFIHGNLRHVQEYTQNLMRIVRLYQTYYPNSIQEIQAELEAIDLEFLQEDLPKIINSMNVGTDRICQIVLSLRNFSRMDEAELKAVDIHEGIDSTLMILQHRLKNTPKSSAIAVIKNYGNLPLVECYPGQLNQVMMNVLVNAIDAIEEFNDRQQNQENKTNSGQIIICTSAIDSQWVQIAISDNGIGISVEIQQRIFNPFFTTKPVGKGTGMGMSISYQIITKNHHGTLKCLSTPGEGTEFVIQVPIRQMPQQP